MTDNKTKSTVVSLAGPDEWGTVYQSILEGLWANERTLREMLLNSRTRDRKALAEKLRPLRRAVRDSKTALEVIGDGYADSIFKKYVDPNRLNDDDYIDDISNPKKDNKLKPGKRNQRDKRFGYPDKFWRWVHKKKKKELKRITGRDLTIDDVKPWHDNEWFPLPENQKDPYELAKPLN